MSERFWLRVMFFQPGIVVIWGADDVVWFRVGLLLLALATVYTIVDTRSSR